MSASNNVNLMGRLTKDPEFHQSAKTGVARLRIAVNRVYKREGQPDADFFSCTAFGKTADFVQKYLHKGTRVVLNGQIQNDNYTDKKTGQTIYGTVIIIDSIEFAESKSASQASAGGQNVQGNYDSRPDQQAPQQKNSSVEPAPFDDDDFMNIPEGLSEEVPFGEDGPDVGEESDELPFI